MGTDSDVGRPVNLVVFVDGDDRRADGGQFAGDLVGDASGLGCWRFLSRIDIRRRGEQGLGRMSETDGPNLASFVPPPPVGAGSVIRRPRVWPVFVAVGAVLPVMVGVWIVAFFLWGVIRAAVGAAVTPQTIAGEAMRTPLFLLPVLVAISVGNAGIAVCGGWLSPLKIRRRLALGPGTAGWGAIVLLSVATLTMGVAAGCLLQLTGVRADQGTNQLLTDLAKNASPVELAALVFVVSVFPAVCEELLYRGYVQTRLVARWGSVVGIGLSGLFFALIHMDVVQTPVMIFVGSYLGWAAYRSGSTRTSMVCHLFNNGLAVGLAGLGSKAEHAADTVGAGQLWAGVAVAGTVCAVCTWFANRALPKRAGNGKVVWTETTPVGTFAP